MWLRINLTGGRLKLIFGALRMLCYNSGLVRCKINFRIKTLFFNVQLWFIYGSAEFSHLYSPPCIKRFFVCLLVTLLKKAHYLALLYTELMCLLCLRGLLSSDVLCFIMIIIITSVCRGNRISFLVMLIITDISSTICFDCRHLCIECNLLT